MSTYVFRNSDTESVDRFASLERCYDPVSTAHLAALGIGDGLRCLEVGTGSGSIANWLADRVGHGGRVVATDIDTRRVGAVAENVEVWSHDIVNDELPEATFDLARRTVQPCTTINAASRRRPIGVNRALA
jgi:tRNA A58 N-methylase Trm61